MLKKGRYFPFPGLSEVRFTELSQRKYAAPQPEKRYFYNRNWLYAQALFPIWADNLRKCTVLAKKNTPRFLKMVEIFPFPKNHLPFREQCLA